MSKLSLSNPSAPHGVGGFLFWGRSSIGRVPDCLSGGCRFKSGRPRYGGCSSVGRASDCGSEGRGFKPLQSPSLKNCISSSSFLGLMDNISTRVGPREVGTREREVGTRKKFFEKG